MSDILIKGMEMPESCWACRFNVDAWCTATIQKNKYNDDVYDYARDKTKPDWCPLVEVPTPHGRLIDADGFMSEKRHLYCQNCEKRKGMKNGKMKMVYDIGDAPCRSCGIGDVLDDIEDAPTVIEAEENDYII